MTAAIVGPPWFRDICAGYLRSLGRKGRRPNTLRAYVFELRAFGRWLELENVADPAQLTGSRLERFQDWRAVKVTARTQQVSAAALRGSFRWASIQEPPLVDASLWLRITTPRNHPLLPRPIARADLDRILMALLPRPNDLLRLGRRALFLVILSSGARISEALSLDRGQFQARTATVLQKGGTQKLLVISAAAERAIEDYLEARQDECSALFVDHGLGRKWLARLTGAYQETEPALRLTKKGAQRMWDTLYDELSIKRFTSHQIRHTCATELIRQGVDSLVVARHLGHSDMSSISGYAEIGLATRQQMLEVLDERIRRAS